jgi:hypothetical protein
MYSINRYFNNPRRDDCNKNGKVIRRLQLKTKLIINAMLALSLFIYCSKDNPLETESNSWVRTELPAELQREWLLNGEIVLFFSRDSVVINKPTAFGSPETVVYSVKAVEKMKDDIRLMLETKDNGNIVYMLLYCYQRTGANLLAAWNTAFSTSERGAYSIPLDSITLVPRGTWEPISFPVEFIGDWFNAEAMDNLILRRNKLVVAGQEWEIAASETDYSEKRLILHNGNAYRVLYLLSQDNRCSRFHFSQGQAASAVQAIRLPVEEGKDYYCYYIPEKDFIALETGSHWVYNYSFTDSRHNNIADYSSNSEYIRRGFLELRVEELVSSSGAGPVFEVLETLSINDENLHQYGYILLDSVTAWDSTHVFNDTTLIRRFQLVIKGDSIYLRNDSNEVYFSQLEYDSAANVNLCLFTYPDSSKPDLPLSIYRSTLLKGKGINTVSAFDAQFGNSGYQAELKITLSAFIPGVPD